YQSLARVEGVDPLWCWSHIRRYFIRAGDAHVQLRGWRDQWVARIGDLYTAHRGMAAAEVGTAAYTQASAEFDQALKVIDTVRREHAAIYSLHPAAKRVLANSRPGMGRPGPPPGLPRHLAGQQPSRESPTHPRGRPQKLLRQQRQMGR